MVTVTFLSGPNAGRPRDVTDADPHGFFAALLQQGWTWVVDYSGADETETHMWFRAELVARVIRALSTGKCVQFLDRTFQVLEGQEVLDVAQSVEDAVVGSGRLVTIDSDDERGLVIGVRGYEV